MNNYINKSLPHSNNFATMHFGLADWLKMWWISLIAVPYQELCTWSQLSWYRWCNQGEFGLRHHMKPQELWYNQNKMKEISYVHILWDVLYSPGTSGKCNATVLDKSISDPLNIVKFDIIRHQWYKGICDYNGLFGYFTTGRRFTITFFGIQKKDPPFCNISGV